MLKQPLPQSKLQQILLEAYLMGEQSKEMTVTDLIERIKTQLMHTLYQLKDEEEL